MLIHYLKLIFRGFNNNRLYSFLNISGFAIGFAEVMIISLFIINEITVDHNFDNCDNHSDPAKLAGGNEKPC